jgi:hypothetical protein
MSIKHILAKQNVLAQVVLPLTVRLGFVDPIGRMSDLLTVSVL